MLKFLHIFQSFIRSVFLSFQLNEFLFDIWFFRGKKCVLISESVVPPLKLSYWIVSVSDNVDFWIHFVATLERLCLVTNHTELSYPFNFSPRQVFTALHTGRCCLLVVQDFWRIAVVWRIPVIYNDCGPCEAILNHLHSNLVGRQKTSRLAERHYTI